MADYTLHHGDALAVLKSLPDGIYDFAVVDPPYGINGGKGGDAKDYGKVRYGSGFDDTEDYIRDACVPVIELLIAKCKAVAVTPGIRCMSFYPRPRDIGCFWTPAACTHGPWGFTTFQPILYYGKDWRAGRGAMPSGKAVTERAEKNGHPCPKPIVAWTWLVDKVCPPGSTVVDPFMGSGTTGVACMNTGRNFIGIEQSPEYIAIAKRRIAAAKAKADAALFAA